MVLEADGGLDLEEVLLPGPMLAWAGADSPGAGISWGLQEYRRRQVMPPTIEQPGARHMQLLKGLHPSPRR
jgi:hypothetical protein